MKLNFEELKILIINAIKDNGSWDLNTNTLIEDDDGIDILSGEIAAQIFERER